MWLSDCWLFHQANSPVATCVTTALPGAVQPQRTQDQGLQDGEQRPGGAGQTPVVQAERRQPSRARQLDRRHQVGMHGSAATWQRETEKQS